MADHGIKQSSMKVGDQIKVVSPENIGIADDNYKNKIVTLVRTSNVMGTQAFYDAEGYCFVDLFIDHGWISPLNLN